MYGQTMQTQIRLNAVQLHHEQTSFMNIIKLLNFGTPKIIAVIYLKFKP